MKKLTFITCLLLSTFCHAQVDSTTIINEYDLQSRSAKMTFADVLKSFEYDYGIDIEVLAKWISEDATEAEGYLLIYDYYEYLEFRNGEKEPFLKTQLLFLHRLKEYRKYNEVPVYHIKKVKRND